MPQPTTAGPSDRLTVEVDRRGPSAVLVLHGEVDPATAPGLRRAVVDALDAGARQVTFDLGSVSFAGASLLREIVAVRGAGAEAAVASPPGAVRRILDATGLLDDLPVSA